MSGFTRFFQLNTRFSLDSFRTLDNVNLTIESSNLEANELSHLWAAIGSKIVTSVLYNLRLSVIEDIAIKKSVTTIKNSSITTH